MGAYNELTDLEFCENNKRSRSSGRIVQSLFSIPNWIVLAGGMAIGTMLGRSSSSASPTEGIHGDVPMVESYSTKELVSCGPWGGEGGTPFYDGRGDIVEILVTHNAERVLCIETSYNQGDASFKAAPHGTSSAGAQSTQVTLQFPEEYVVQVKGTIDTSSTMQARVVSSLTLITNRRIYGPFGRESGTSFKSLPGGRVVGFFGRSGTLLDQLGVLTHPSESFSTTSTNSVDVDVEENWVALDGPWGGADGSLFHDGQGRILEIVVTYHKNHVNSLQVFYEYGAAQFAGSVYGVPTGKESKISFNHPEEYLVKVKGTIGKISGHNTITSLTFITNKCRFGPYGSPTGEVFESSPGREVTGFFGRCSSRLDQIGVITGTPGHSSTAAVQGPWGAEHGSQFCSGRGELTEIYITFTKAHLVALQTTYSLGSDMGNFKSDSWGGKSPARIEKISLHSPEEYLIQVKGTIDAVNGKEAVTSLTFITNQKTYGPYGLTSGKSFESTPAKIGGFFGRCESHIHQLGVITELSSGIQLRRMFAETTVVTKNDTDIEEHLLGGGELVLNGKERNYHIDTAQKIEHLNNGIEYYPGSGPSYVTKQLVSSDVLVIQQGPWGGSSGQEFYDGRGDIVDLNISYNDNLITSIQVGYEQGGTNFQAPLHGGKGTQHVKINMDSSIEHVLQIKGTSGLVDAAPAIMSLTVVTNKAIYGPYGSTQGKQFQSSREGTVVGLFGRASAILHQLGVITLINAAPSNGQCIRCATPYTYSCQCIVQQSPVPNPSGFGNSSSLREPYFRFLKHVGPERQQPHLRRKTSPTPDSSMPLEKLPPMISSPSETDEAPNVPGKPQPKDTPPKLKDFPPDTKGAGQDFPKTTSPQESKQVPIGPDKQNKPRDSSEQQFQPKPKDPKQPTIEFPEDPKGSAPSRTEKEWSDMHRGTQVDDIFTVQGPWGLKAETNFYDGNGNISEIEVAYSKEFILRIQTTYVLNGMSFKQSPQGGPGGDVAKVTLQYPDEYLVQVRGTTREVSSVGAAVTSLTFVTNKRIYGPYGSATGGSSFETTLHGRVMGFYGRASSCVHSIGVLTAQVEDQPDTETVIVQEPWGGQGGVSFYEGGGEVTELLVSYSDRQVVSLQTTYKRKGKSFRSNQHGGQHGAGAKQAKITLKSPEEYLVQVKGSSYLVNGLLVIESLEFVTNKQRYGPFGASNPEGQLRSTQKGGRVVGFFGKAGHFLDQLGVIVSLPWQRHDLVTCQGSWGGPGGSPFSDGRGEIVELLVTYNKKQVVSLQVTYEQGGSRYKSQLRGGVGNGESTQVSFGPEECLVQVKGTTGGMVPGGTMVTSLTFITNKQTHGPFGAVMGGAFETKASGKVVGVFGRAGSFLDSIGFITELRPGKALPPTVKLGPWGGEGGHEFCCGQGDVVKVVVYHNRTQINGIQVTYEQGGVSFEPVTYGGTSGTASEISVDFPDEHVTQVRGTTAKVGFLGLHQVITSLTFITNKQKYGPYGAVKGSEFGSPASRLVRGFFGRAGDSLDQFGVFTTLDLESWAPNLGGGGANDDFGLENVKSGDPPSGEKVSDVTPKEPREEKRSELGPKDAVPPVTKPGDTYGKPQPGKGNTIVPRDEVPSREKVSDVTPKEPREEKRSELGPKDAVPPVTKPGDTYGKPQPGKGNTIVPRDEVPSREKVSDVTPKEPREEKRSELGPKDAVPPVTKPGDTYGKPQPGKGITIVPRDEVPSREKVSDVTPKEPREEKRSELGPKDAVPPVTKPGDTYGKPQPGKGITIVPRDEVPSREKVSDVTPKEPREEKRSELGPKDAVPPVTKPGDTYGKPQPGKGITIVPRDEVPSREKVSDVTPKEPREEKRSELGPKDAVPPVTKPGDTYGKPQPGKGITIVPRDEVPSDQRGYLQQPNSRTPKTGNVTPDTGTDSKALPGNNKPSGSSSVLIVVPGVKVPIPPKIESENPKLQGEDVARGSKGSAPSRTEKEWSDMHRGTQVDDIFTVQGPWGLKAETNFYDGNGNISEIEVAYSKEFILRIQTTYVLNGMSFKQSPQGGPGGDVAKVTLQYPDEYLVQVRGTTREVSSVGAAVTSLTFVTNKRIYGPYGSATGGSSFETTLHGRVMGFYGRASSCVHSIGVLTAQVEDQPDTETVIVQEPWGGQGGVSFYEGGGEVTELLVSYSDRQVVSLQTTYKRKGKSFRSNQHGGQHGAGAKQAKITLKSPEEYLVQVKGSSYLVNGLLVIESLEFVTNKQRYGPFGASNPEGQLRSTQKGGRVVGFFGKAGHFLDQLGVIVSLPWQRHDLVTCQGSWGGPGGSPFSDGRGEIVELLVTYNKKQVVSLQVTYEQGGSRYKSQLRGGVGNGESTQVSFGPEECLVQVKGTTGGMVPGGTMVTSLTFITNKQTHGPFGAVMGGAFETKASGKVVGVFGRAGSFLDSIGFITELRPGKALPPTVKLGPWGGEGGHEFCCGQGDVVKVVVYHNRTQINGIQVTYEQGGVSFEPVTYGGTSGTASEISVDFPDEHVTQVRGTTAKVGFLGLHQVITSLTFITNKQKYGPYGAVKGSEFGSPASRLVRGFFGRAGDSLDQFGVFTTLDLESWAPNLGGGGANDDFGLENVKSGDPPSGEKVSDVTPKEPREEKRSELGPKDAVPPVTKPGDTYGKPQPGKGNTIVPRDEVPSREKVSDVTPKEPREEKRSELGPKDAVPPVTKPGDTYGKPQPGKGITIVPRDEVPSREKVSDVTPKEPREEKRSELGPKDAVPPVTKPGDTYGKPQPGKGITIVPRDEVPSREKVSDVTPKEPREEKRSELGPKDAVPPVTKPGDTYGKPQPGKGITIVPRDEVPSREKVSDVTPKEPREEKRSELGPKDAVPPVTKPGDTYGKPQPGKGITIVPRDEVPSDQRGYLQQPNSRTPKTGNVTPDTGTDSKALPGNNKPSGSSSVLIVVPGVKVPIPPKIESENPKLQGEDVARGSKGSAPSRTEKEWSDMHRGTQVDDIFTVQGPWGLKAETNFYDGNGNISEIEVAYSKEFILRIQTTYVLNGMSFKQSPQGGPGGDVAKVTLQYPDEYLVQVRGTTREVSSVGAAVTSLTFVTNKRIYGPYGSATGGSSFETTLHGRVMGFYGRASSCVHSIGVLTAQVEDQPDTETVIVQEPWGGQGGVSFYEGGGEVTELLVSYSDRQVVSLQTTYKRKGKSFRSNQHGGQHGAGAKQAKITLKSPEEYLVQVKGSSYLVNGLLVIESLEFVTNKQRYGPFGASNPEGQLRSTQKGGRVVGFFGKAGHFLDQLGVIVSLPWQRHDLVTCQGSWGGPGGSPFSDGRGEIVELLVTYNKKQVVSLQVTYEQGGSRYKSQLRGGVGNGESTQVSFGPEECLVQVKGTTGGMVPGGTMVTSLTFITNKQTHGPFGAVMGGAFETKASGKVVGVFGRAGSFLDSIGFITELRPGKALPPTVKLGPWGGEGGHEFCCGQGDVVKVVVYHNRTQINGIQVTYEQGGVSFEPVTYGGTSGTASEISVDFPDEHVTQVRGTTAKVGFLGLHQVITSLTFITNKQKYGPYGAVKGSEFGSPASRLVRGFFGRAGDSLDQFGVFTTLDLESWAPNLGGGGANDDFGLENVKSGDPPSGEKVSDVTPKEPREEKRSELGPKDAVPPVTKPGDTYGKPQPGKGITIVPRDEVPSREKVSDVTPKEPREEKRSELGPKDAVPPVTKPGDTYGKPQPGKGITIVPRDEVPSREKVSDVTPKEPREEKRSELGPKDAVPPVTKPGDTYGKPQPGKGITIVPRDEVPSREKVSDVTPKEPREEKRSELGPKDAVPPVTKPGDTYGKPQPGKGNTIVPRDEVPSREKVSDVTPKEPREEKRSELGPKDAVPPVTKPGDTYGKPQPGKGITIVPRDEVPSREKVSDVTPKEPREEKRSELGPKDAVPPVTKPGDTYGKPQPGKGITIVPRDEVPSDQRGYLQQPNSRTPKTGNVTPDTSTDSKASSGNNKPSGSSSLPNVVPGVKVPGILDNSSSFSASESDHSSSSQSFRSSKSSDGSSSSLSKSSSNSRNSSRSSSPRTSWIPQMPASTPFFGKLWDSRSSDAESSCGEDGSSFTGSTEVEGPWGGDGGDLFYDGTGDVHEIRVAYSEKHVTSLQFLYVSDGVVTEGTKVGGSHGDKFVKVVLKSPEEYITCIKGTFGVVSRHKIITSLIFVSNKDVYGPYGTIEGQEFTSSGYGKVVGIFGSAGSYVDQLGVFSTTVVTTSSSTEGSWGGDGGYVFSDGRGDIVGITVTYNRDQIVSFQAIYNQNGARFLGRLHGGYGGKSQSQTIVLNFPDEYLIQVQGTYGRVCALSNVITSLSFITSKKTYGPFGAISGQEFKTSEGTQVVGFHGRSCNFLDRFGVFTTKEQQHGLSSDAERDTGKVLAQGPWGGAGGSPFYDGRGDIVEILIEYMEDCIVSLQATYEQGGGVFKTTARFGPGGETAKIKFDQEQEQLLQIQGSIGDTFDTDMITSLTFITTKKTYGPYGTVTNRKFESKKHGKVVGFFGRSDEFLDQIGVVTEYSPKDYDVILSQGPWGGKNGTVFYDGKGTVVGIIVTYNQKQIISFQAIYSQGTANFKADFHGGPGGKTAKIIFNFPSEELLQVKGTIGKVGGNLVVTSLTFCSSKRVFGPFGSVRDTKFESSPSGKVKGFYGKAGVCLDQIGFITQFSPKKLGDEVVTQGPWGGPNGSYFYGGRGEILDIMVCYSKTQILSLQMTYEHNGASYKGEKQGADGGDFRKIPLKETNSYLKQVKGTFGKVAGTICITSLTFVTSKHTYGPFGSARGTHFQSYKSGKIVGLFGKASTSIDQLGVITQICAESQVPRVQMKNMGPWGGQGGVEFHDGHGHIRDIDVHYTNHQVVAFQAVYEQGGIVLHGTNHGGTSKASRHVHHAKISFHDLDEYLIQITGTYGLVSGGKMITSLTFITTKQKYGPFGHEAGESFGTPGGQKIMGFFGRAAACLDQIGVVVIEERLNQPPAISPKLPKLDEIEEKVRVEGPWGVDQEINFYGGRGNIIEIEVAYNNDTILRIQTTFQENGTNFKQEALGGPGGEVAKIMLQYPDEYLVQVKGTTREVSLVGVAVTTLTFITNKRSYGPYGSVMGGSSFETTQHGRVMGFYGSATSCLHSIGVLAEVEDLPDTDTVVVQDAWGGRGGEPFFDGRGDVTEVLVTYNDRHVVSLQITYRHGGKIFKAKQHGGQKGVGAGQTKITLNYPDEYLMQVRGSSHEIDGALIMESLDFITNKRSYGPYGALKPQGQLRTTPKNGRIVSFFGKAGYFLDQLGVIITFPSQRDDLLICQGSWGGPGGSSFCDGRGEIVELHVKYNKKQIISLQVTYEQGGIQYKSQLRGGGDDGESEKISFGPGEYLVQVKGTTGIIVPDGTMVTSLTIITNKQSHGPFGAVAGCAFETKASGKVVGLFGRSGRFLDSIGFITELHPGKALPATVKLGPWGGQGGREFYGGQGDIVKVVVYHNKHHINGIQTTYEQGGVSFEPVTFGNTNGHASEISLDFPNEYLAQVKGTTAKVGSHQVITSLAFITNKQKYGPYGHKKGSDFKSPSKRLVMGFFGRAGDALNQFGFFATASSGATDRYLRVHLDGWTNSWKAFIKKEVSSAGKFFMEEFGKLPAIGHSHSPRVELGSPKGESGSEKGESGKHSFRVSLSGNLKPGRV